MQPNLFIRRNACKLVAPEIKQTIAHPLYFSDTHVSPDFSDISSMCKGKTPRPASRCAYIHACYLAEELKCFGYKTDCPLYQKSNGEFYNEDRFHDAMNRLIDKARAKAAKLT